MRENIYSVSQINKYIKNMFTSEYLLQNVEIRGEISNLKYHSTGHVYFTLKDEKSAIKGVMFASNTRTGLKFRMQEGMQVIVKGSLDVFERDGTYQVYAREIRQDGIGNLYEEFEKLKARLAESGMFDPMYKRDIPKFAKTLGVVTAPTGAAVRDIIDVATRRNPGIQIVLFPAIVQGSDAPDSIVTGIRCLEKYGVDVMIVGRGGGSIEDLWGFNDEKVAEAIFNCTVPIISAVGHETDFTIADFVSDLRAPTPSAAAELAVCDINLYLNRLNELRDDLARGMELSIRNARTLNSHYYERLSLLSPVRRLNEDKKHLDVLKDALKSSMNNKLVSVRHRLELDAGKLHGVSPLVKLSSGYSYVTGTNGNVKSVHDVSCDENIKICVTDGYIVGKVIETVEETWKKTN